MVSHITEQEAEFCLVDDHTQIGIHPHRPEIFVLHILQPMKIHARIGGIDLKVEGRGFNGFLLVAGEFGEAVGEGFGYAEVHGGPYPSIIATILPKKEWTSSWISSAVMPIATC